MTNKEAIKTLTAYRYYAESIQEYEAIEMGIDALRKKVPKKPKKVPSRYIEREEQYACRECSGEINVMLDNYCRWCGQAIE